jgi:hypothetical protein
MTRVTDFHLVNEFGERVLCDAFGNNVAFKCHDCGHPMLRIVLPKQNGRGSNPDNSRRLPTLRISRVGGRRAS